MYEIVTNHKNWHREKTGKMQFEWVPCNKQNEKISKCQKVVVHDELVHVFSTGGRFGALPGMGSGERDWHQVSLVVLSTPTLTRPPFSSSPDKRV